MDRQVGYYMDLAAIHGWKVVKSILHETSPGLFQALRNTTALIADACFIVVFPENEMFSKKLVDRPEQRAMLREAIIDVFGVGWPIRCEFAKADQ